MKYKCILCRTEEEPNKWYSDNGVNIEGEPVICEICYLNLKPLKEE